MGSATVNDSGRLGQVYFEKTYSNIFLQRFSEMDYGCESIFDNGIDNSELLTTKNILSGTGSYFNYIAQVLNIR